MLSVSKAVIYFSCEAFELSKGFYLLLSNSTTKRNMPQACIRVCCENKTISKPNRIAIHLLTMTANPSLKLSKYIQPKWHLN